MKPRTLAGLTGVVAALALFIAFYERKLPSSDERRDSAKRVFDFEAEEIVRLEIEWQGKRVAVERDPKSASGASDAPAFPLPREWRLVEPLTARADRGLADKLLGDLAGLEIVRKLEGVARKDVGLEPARGKIVWKSGASEGALELGGEVPASSNLVAAATGKSDLLVVAQSIASGLDRAPGDWRSKEVLSAAREEIERIRLVPAAGDEVVLSRQGERFVVERPFADAADRDQVDPLLSDLTALRAERFLDAPLSAESELGLAVGIGRIELALKGRSAPFVIEIGAEVGAAGDAEGAPAASPEGSFGSGAERARYVRAAGQSFEAKSRLAEPLGKAVEEWRSKSWSVFESWKIERIRIEDATGKLELVRSAGDWMRDGQKISYGEVGDLLYALTSARADRIVTGKETAAYPPASPTLTAIFADANGAEETLTLYAAVDNLRPARVSGRDVVLLLPPAATEEIDAKLAAVRAAKPVEEKKAESPEQTKEPDTAP